MYTDFFTREGWSQTRMKKSATGKAYYKQSLKVKLVLTLILKSVLPKRTKTA